MAVVATRGRRRRYRLCAAAALIFPCAGHAAETGEDAQSTWIVTLGAGAEYGAAYPGATRNSFSVLPSFDFRRFGDAEEYSAADDNISLDLVSLGTVTAGPVIGFRESRSIFDDNRLAGLQRIRWGADVGVALRAWVLPQRLRAHAEVRQAVSNGTGLVADLGLDAFQPVGEKVLLSLGARASLANGAYMRRYFGISTAESARNGVLPAYDASSGLKSVGLIVSAQYAITPEWTAEVYDRFDRLTGDAADSPVTSRLGTRNQNVVGFSLSKSFNVTF